MAEEDYQDGGDAAAQAFEEVRAEVALLRRAIERLAAERAEVLGRNACREADVQWLDQVSAQTLFFVARRLQAESVGLVFASRTPIDGTAGLPTLMVGGLDDGDARRLLESAFPGRLDAAILDRIVAEARVPHDPDALAAALDGLVREGADLAVVFGASANWLFKEIRVSRMWDAEKRVLIYLVWSTKSLSTEGSPFNAVSAVPVDTPKS